SSFSDTMLRHAQDLAHRLVQMRQLGPNSLVVELASNDGYLLKNFLFEGVPVLGIEPAANVARAAEAVSVRTLFCVFSFNLAREMQLQGDSAAVGIDNYVWAHVDDLNGFDEGIRVLLKPQGVAVIEVPYVKDMLDRCEFDPIYHGPFCYFSVTA